MTVNLNDQLMPGSFEHTLNYLIDRFDLSAFDAAFHNDKKGAPAWFSCLTSFAPLSSGTSILWARFLVLRHPLFRLGFILRHHARYGRAARASAFTF
jgi:hypothetical protein